MFGEGPVVNDLALADNKWRLGDFFALLRSVEIESSQINNPL
jgi:hypothetical protein